MDTSGGTVDIATASCLTSQRDIGTAKWTFSGSPRTEPYLPALKASVVSPRVIPCGDPESGRECTCRLRLRVSHWARSMWYSLLVADKENLWDGAVDALAGLAWQLENLGLTLDKTKLPLSRPPQRDISILTCVISI